MHRSPRYCRPRCLRSVQLLPFLHPPALVAAPKLFIGYSDNTSVRRGSVRVRHHGLHGPMLERRLASGAAGYDERSFLALVSNGSGGAGLEGLDVLHPGQVQGPMFGGTIAQLVASLGTPFAFSPPEGCVLFLEDVNERPYRIDRMLTQLRLSGILSRARALVFGEMRVRRAQRHSDREGSDRASDRRVPRAGAVRISIRTYERSVLDALRCGCASSPRLAHVSSSRNPLPPDRPRLHLIGVCGTAMATLAALLKSRGHLQGLDQQVYPPMSDFLVAEGITTFSGTRRRTSPATSISSWWGTPSRVVMPSSKRCSSASCATARCRSDPRSLPLGCTSIVLAGTHGKTTTTALTGWLLTHGGLDPSMLVGGIALNFGGSERPGPYAIGRRLELSSRKGRDFVIEGDEHDSAFFDKTAKFLKYLPEIAVINNIEFDHADIYADLEDVLVAFRRLVRLVPRNGLLLVGADSPHRQRAGADRGESCGNLRLDEAATWRGSAVEHRDGVTRFDVHRKGKPFGRFESPLLGVHNVRNALAAIAAGTRAGLTPATLAEGLRQFKGIKRRLETVGALPMACRCWTTSPITRRLFTRRRARCERAIPAAACGPCSSRSSASSCRRVFQADFARAFSAADEVVAAAVFRSSLPEAERLSAEQLVEDLYARVGTPVTSPRSTISSRRSSASAVMAMSWS